MRLPGRPGSCTSGSPPHTCPCTAGSSHSLSPRLRGPMPCQPRHCPSTLSRQAAPEPRDGPYGRSPVPRRPRRCPACPSTRSHQAAPEPRQGPCGRHCRRYSADRVPTVCERRCGLRHPRQCPACPSARSQQAAQEPRQGHFGRHRQRHAADRAPTVHECRCGLRPQRRFQRSPAHAPAPSGQASSCHRPGQRQRSADLAKTPPNPDLPSGRRHCPRGPRHDSPRPETKMQRRPTVPCLWGV
mmetsp:Transcript_12340/g.33164  ORF Transcript_12340/g.33164 Transcript_12340/m.33164 type:complete len:242 (+) Transcript_12340:211-936(+)